MMYCDHCGAGLPDEAIVCPTCGAHRYHGGLSRPEQSALDRGLAEGLARSVTESLLARHDSIAELTRDIDAAGPLTYSELQAAVQKTDDAPALAEIEQMLTPEVARLDIEGLRLFRLVDRDGADMAILRKGLLFLKHRRFAEAVEWWSIHREQLDITRSRMQLVLLMMEIFTHTLAGNRERAAALRKELKGHPHYAEHRRRTV